MLRANFKSLQLSGLLLFFVVLIYCTSIIRAQTTVTISGTVETAGIDRPGINLGGIGGYGSQQLLKSLNYVNGGYFPGGYAAATYPCRAGGSNTATTWYNDITSLNGYPANFWAGAAFVAINSATGTSYGSGTITASTANTGGSGITFTLSPAISSACDPSQNDVLIVRLTKPNTLISPYQELNNHICPEATWNTTDTSPSSTNTEQSLQMPSGCGLTFYIDATVSNRTNTNPSLTAQQVNFINLNGSYTATFKAKCITSGCSINFNLGRLGGPTYVGSTTVTPGYSTTQGAGWTTYTYPFNATETGPVSQTISYSFSCSGTCLLQDADVIEGSTLPGNTTVFRDAVVSELQKIHPGSIRYMDGSQWCSDVADEIATTGNRRWCGDSNYGPGTGQALGYSDVLALADFIGSDVLLSVGQLNQPADWTMLINWLNSSGWISTYAAKGHTIYLEDGNEAWNSGVGATLYFGNGTAYGYTLGPNMAAAKAAAGYNPNVIKLVGNTWVAGSQGYGPFGWIHNSLTIAERTPNGLPDFVDDAPYTLNYLGNIDTNGGNVATTGAPFLDEFAEIENLDSVTTPPLYTESMLLNQQYAKANFGVNTLVYEVNQSTLSGIGATQTQLDQIGSSVGNALATMEHVLLMQRDSQVTGPIHVFTLAEPYTGYTCNGGNCVGGVVMPLWGTNIYMATGPGQTADSANVDRPLAIALEVINNAIGSNNNLMSVTQSGTPTFSYPGGQPQGGSNSISPNSAVPYVNCFSYSNGAQAWTTICFNNNLTTAESVALTGAGAPTGSVSETVFPGPSNVITDHNENTYLGGSTSPVVTLPSAKTTSGTSYTIPPASMMVLTYTTGGTPTLAIPTFSLGTGTYSGSQQVTISFPSGSTGCVGINSVPTATTPGTCGTGGTVYTGPITISSSETVSAIATQQGSFNSLLASATYTLTTPTVATPTFSPAGGTYTTSQSVTISDTTADTTIYYTTNGTVPTTSSSVYNGSITISASETLEAIAVKAGYTTSSPATAAYTINSVLPTPTFSPGGGTYTAPLPVTITDATAGTTLYYTTNGSTPTTSSAVYTTPVTVSTSNTLQAIAVKPGYTTSAAGTAAYTISSVVANPSVSTSCYQGSGSSTFTFGPLNTAGANAIAIVVASFNNISSVTDNMGNGNATGLPAASGGSPNNQLFYWQNPAVGSGHTFTVNGSGGLYSSACVFVMSGVSGLFTGVQSASSTSYGSSSCQAGSVVPASGPQILIAGFGTYAPAGTPTLDSSYTVAAYQPGTPGSAFGEAAGYLIQQSGAATNPKWNWGNSASTPSCVIAAFGGGTSQPQAATPTFNPGGGIYTSSQSVTISDATPGTTIYYTTNGTTPTASSSIYTGTPITVSLSETLQAIAVESGYTTSGVGTAVYALSAVLPAPTISPAAGAYTESQPSTSADYGIHIHGDSISVPAGAGCSNSAICYDALLDTEIGWNTAANTNDANSGDQSEDMNVRVFNDENPTVTNNPIQTTLIGTNDALYVGSPSGYLTTFTQVQAATHAWLALANTSKIPGSMGSVNGTCSNDTTYPTIIGVQCTGSNNTVTWSNVVAPGGTIYLWYRAFQSSNGTATCTVDGSLATDTLTSTQTLAAQAIVGLPTSRGLSNDVQLARFAGYAPNSTHTVTCTNTNAFSYLGLGLPPTTRNTALYSPTVAMGGVVYLQNDGNSTVTAAYNNQSSSVAALLYNDNLNILWFNPRLYLDANCDMGSPYTTGCPGSTSPPFHPNDVGHRQLANGFEDTLNILTTPPSLVVTMSDTAGATIYYTTDGTTPTTTSTVYTGPIRATPSQTIQAIAVEAGYTTSTIASAAYSISPVLAAPTFTPAPGMYTSAQSVSISDATYGTTIYYTTNGTTPTTSSSVYGGPITVSGTETLEAIAVKNGYATSAPATGTYTFSAPLPAPDFSPASGTYAVSQQVTISATAGTTIYYTTDGTTPTTSSNVYSGPLTVSSSETLEAIAAKAGYTSSAAGTAVYTISSGTSSNPTVSTSCYQGSGANTFTFGPLNTSGASAIAIIVASFNDIASVTDNMGNGNAIGLTAASGGSPNNQIFYWQTPKIGNGHTFTVNGNGGLYASACVFVMSGVSGTYSDAQSASSAGYGSSSCQAGSIAPASGPQVIITGFAVYGATGVPTLDSSYTVGAYQAGTPGSAFGEAAGYILQPAGAATNPKWNWSNAASTPGCVIAAFGGGAGTGQPTTAAAPTFSPAAGTYTSSQLVTISDTTPGTTIYYTTNGTTPTTSSSVYTGPVVVSSSETLEAIAVEAGYTNSVATTGAYVINPASGGSTTISFASGQFTASSFFLNGGSTITSAGALQLTDGGYGEARSAWFSSEVPVGNFVTDFTFQIPYANADGMTFTIQGQSPTALGGTGGLLGYQGINNSVAIKFDLYDNSGEGIDSTGLYIDGATPMLPSVNLSTTGINLHSGDIMAAHLVYDGTNLTMTLTDTVTTASVVELFPINIPATVGGSTAYVGFTGGTGGLSSIQNVLTWSFTAKP